MTTLGAGTVFQVKDLSQILRFYCDVLGFEEDFQFGGQYAGLHLGEAQLHPCAHTLWARPAGGGTVAIFCDEVDRYYSHLRALGANIQREPTDEPYGMRDFVVRDPDGNLLSFGCQV